MADDFDKKWEAFEVRCKACHNCGLRDGCTNVVIYRGSRKAPLMIIGEAPGENEDIQGLPFVGRSGQLLQNLLGSYGFTNQFMLVRPKVILLCGSTAYEGFFGTKPVMHDVRGRFIEKNGYYIMTTYHPAYALRNPANKMPIYEDMGKVRDKLTEIGAMPPLEPVKE